MDLDRSWFVNFIAIKIQQVSLDRSNNTGVTDVKIDSSVIEGKSSCKMIWLTFSSKLDWLHYPYC